MNNDLQKEANRRKKANQRAREKGLPEPYPKADREAIARRKDQNEADVAFANGLDASGQFYKSEARCAVDLLKIYEGVNLQDTDEDDEETGDDAKKRYKSAKKEPRPNPSNTIIKIRASQYEPDSPKEFRELTEVNEVVSFQRWLDLRDKARKDLFWLCRLLGKDPYHSVHQVVCDQFIQKNFDGLYFPDYTLNDFHQALDQQKRFANDGITPTREALILDPRGSYKSVLDGCDAVSWLINCPDIRILILTGEYKLAGSFMKEIKHYFHLPKKAIPSAFQLLFPEYVLTGVDGVSKEPLQCPARNLAQKEASIWVNSIEAATSGWHCDVRKADDVINDKNSDTSELREKLKFQFDGTDDLLDQWGISDVIGTRYFTDDWYGTRMSSNEEGNVSPYKYHMRGAWVVKPEYRQLKLRELTEDMVTLTFPQKLSWRYLHNTLLKKGERGFRNQQLNEPTDTADDSGFQLSFSIDVLRAHSYPMESAPKIGKILQAWDWSYSDRKTSDYSVGVTAMLYQQDNGQYALVILEIVFGKWKASELVFQILAFHKKWKPERVLIENANGGELLKLAILQRAQLLGSDILQNTYWMPVSPLANAKKNRIKSLEILLADDRLHFVNGSWIDETFKQLSEYTGAKSTGSKKDDIPDAMSYLVEMMPKIAFFNNPDSVELEQQAEKEEREANRKAAYHFHFGMDYVPPPPPPPTEPERPQDRVRTLLSKIFGGNGLRA